MITLTITLNEATGEIRIDGPVSNKIMMCGLLDIVKDTIMRQPVSRVLVPGNGAVQITPPQNHS